MNSLLPPNATAQERALEAVTARISNVPIPAPDIIDPDTCPEALLPWLAWALSVDDWSADWTLRVKRAQVRNAIAIQRRKGTANSVSQIVEAFGGAVQLREWWQMEPPGEPHTFDMVLTVQGNDGQAASAEFVEAVINAVSRTKPVRSHFSFTQGLQATGAVGMVGGARVAGYRRLQLTQAA